jgi:hypothetical protein
LSRRRVLVAATSALLASLAVACQIIAGIKDHSFQVDVEPDEAGTPDATPDGAAAPDPCDHQLLPARPDAAFDSVTNSYILAVRTIDFSGRDDAGAVLGFDLDGVCTCDTRPDTAHGGMTSCTPPFDIPCDYDSGVDNALAAPFHAVAGFLGDSGSGSALLGDQAECGRETLVFIIGDYNGKADDSQVKVGLIPSYGIREPHDAGEIPDSACTSSPDPPYPAKWDGTDKWSFAEGTAIRKGTEVIPVIVTADAFVTNYRLVVPPVRSVTIFFGAQALEVSSPATIATLIAVDGQGNDLPPGAPAVSFRVSDGIISGRIGTSALLAALGQLKPRTAGGGFLCDDPVFAFTVKKTICGARDILSDPAKDFQPPGGPPFACDAVSMAVRFTGQMAQIGDMYSPDAGAEGGCGTDWSTCQ